MKDSQSNVGEPRDISDVISKMWASFQLAAATTVAVMSVISKFGHYFSMQLLPRRGSITDVRNVGTFTRLYVHTNGAPCPVCDVSTANARWTDILYINR